MHYPLAAQCLANSVILLHLKTFFAAGASPPERGRPHLSYGLLQCLRPLCLHSEDGIVRVRASVSARLPSSSCLFINLPGPNRTCFKE